MRSFLLLTLCSAVTAVMFGFLAKVANAEARDISCADTRYTIETSWLGADVIINGVGSTKIGRPYCQSDASTQMVAELTVKGDDIWCVETFYISMDRLPIAKSSRLLSFALGRVFEYDYLWQADGWIKTDTRTINCTSDKTTKRQKILDKGTID